jgi:hypothetical protein
LSFSLRAPKGQAKTTVGNGPAYRFTVFDLTKLLGFQQINFTDGDAVAHRTELRERRA